MIRVAVDLNLSPDGQRELFAALVRLTLTVPKADDLVGPIVDLAEAVRDAAQIDHEPACRGTCGGDGSDSDCACGVTP